MSTKFRTRARLFLVDAEAVSGTAEALTPAADACKIENLQIEAPVEVEQTNEHQAGLDASASIPGAVPSRMSGDVLIKGAGTAGVAPEGGPLLRGAGLSQTLQAAAIADTAQAGAAGSLTLAAGESAVDNIHVGKVIKITGGTGTLNEARLISGYVGSSKVASVYPDWSVTPDVTTTYNIAANALYVPASTGMETITAFGYLMPASGTTARLQKIVGGVAGMTMRVPANKVGRYSFSMLGKLPENPTDPTTPTGTAYDTPTAPAFIGADAYLGGVAIQINEFSLDLGNDVKLAVDPTEANGYDAAFVNERRIVGSIDPRISDLATRDIFADLRAPTRRDLWLRWGTASGNSVSLWIPNFQYTGVGHGDADGVITQVAPFECPDPDTGVYICIY